MLHKSKAVAISLIPFVVSTMLTGCASSTTISSDPSGAELSIDGKVVGKTPVSFTEGSVWVWTDHRLRLDAPGYEPHTALLQADISPVHLVFGIICVIPLLPLAFVGKYESNYYYTLQKKNSLTRASGFDEVASIDFADGSAPARSEPEEGQQAQ